MATTQSAVRAINAWFNGDNPARYLKSLDNTQYLSPYKHRQLNSYGPHFPLIIDKRVDGFCELLVNTEDKVSNTTSRHQRAVEEVLRSRGYRPTDRTEELSVARRPYSPGTRSFRVWEGEE